MSDEHHDPDVRRDLKQPARLLSLLSAMLGVVPTIAIVGTAFLYFAGYTFLDRYRTGFGLAFGATEMSTGEVVGIGYTVVLAAIVTKFATLLWLTLTPVLIAIAFVGLLLLGAHLRWPGFRSLHNAISYAGDRLPDYPGYALAGCIAGLILMGAPPAGSFAAGLEREWALQQQQRECCFLYTRTDETSVRGFPLAQDHNRIHVLTKAGIVILPPDGLSITEAPPLASAAR